MLRVLIVLLATIFFKATGKPRGSPLILERVEVVEVNNELLVLEARVDKINKTAYALSANYSTLKNLPPHTLRIDIYALFSNEYRPMPITLTRDMCEVFKVEFKWVEAEITKYGKVPKGCPVLKDNWYIKNFIPDTTKFPFESPWKRIKMRFRFFENANKKVFALIDVFLHKEGTYV